MKKPRKKRRRSPTAMALSECRARGWIAEKVEQTLPRCFITKDFLGIVDILALTESTILGLQVTGGDNHGARRTKALAEPRLRRWLELGGRFEIWSFDLRGAQGERKLYTLRTEELTLVDFSAAPPAASAQPAP